MGKLSWVAANALLLSLALGMAGVTNNAWAQEAPGTGLPTVEDPPKGGEPEVEGPAVKMPDDCFLQGRHFNFLEQQIAALEAEAARLKAQITALEVGSPQLVEQITTLNQRLAQINERLGDAYLAAYPWSGWHFRLGMLIQGTAFSGSTNFVAPLQLDVSGEVIDPRTHLGWRGGGALGVTFTEGETSGKTLAPFMVTGYMSAVAGWEYWSVLLPEVRASFLQSPVDDRPGLLWVSLYGGGEFHVEDTFFIDALVGTSVYSTLQRLGGLHGLLMLGWYY